MKRNLSLTYMPILLLFFVLVSFTPAHAGNAPTLVFDGVELVFSEEKNSMDMGKVQQGGACVARITVKNASERVLRIASVRGSCALSVPTWPRKDIQPGEEGVIQIRYDSSRPGPFHRNVIIHANTQTSVTVLKVQGEIIPQ